MNISGIRPKQEFYAGMEKQEPEKKEMHRLNQVAIRMVEMPPLFSEEPMNGPAAAVKVMADTFRDYDREVVAVISEQMNPEEGHATVICSVKNYLKADFFNGTSAILPEKQDTIHLVKEDERWLVKMDNPLQSGMQNHD